MAEEEVKLLGWWLSPFSRRVETALKMKGVSYEYIEEDLFNKSPLLLQYNPIHQKVPVLLHNGKPILESLVILEYIDETWKGNPILPEDPHDRAIARFWAKFIEEKCLLSTWNACWSKGEEQEKGKKEAYECLKTLEGALGNKKFFGGETIGLVDIVGNFIAYWVRDIQEIVGIELFTAEKFPVLFKWSEEFIECPVIKENLPPRDKLIATFKARFEEGKWYK